MKIGAGQSKVGVGMMKVCVGLVKVGMGVAKVGMVSKKVGVGLMKVGMGLTKAGVNSRTDQGPPGWTANYCIAGNTKIGFQPSSTVTNNCNDCKPSFIVWRSGWELRTQLGSSISVTLTLYFLPAPHLTGWYEGRTINTESGEKILHYSVLLCTVLWQHSGSHLIINIIIIISSLQHSLRKSKFIYSCSGCHLAFYFGRSLDCLRSFLDFIWASFANAHIVQPPCVTILRTIWSERTQSG